MKGKILTNNFEERGERESVGGVEEERKEREENGEGERVGEDGSRGKE